MRAADDADNQLPTAERQRNKPDTEMVGGPADAGVCIVQLCMYQEVMSISRRLVGCIVERSL